MRGDETADGPHPTVDEVHHDHKGWVAAISIDEHDGQTRAKVRLRWRDQEAIGVGLSRLAPADRFNAEIGDELAVARALSDLARRMMAGAVQHIEFEEQQDRFRRRREPVNGAGR